MRVVVWGGTSLVGRTLLARLIDADYDVVAISRKEQPSSQAGPRWQKLDLDDPNAVESIPECEIVVSLIPIWTAAALCRALVDRAMPFTRVVAFSSTSVLTKAQSASSDERALANRLLGGEISLQELAPRLKTTILRPTMIYTGSGDRNVEKIAQHLVRFRFFPMIGPGSGLRQPVHSDDLAIAVIQALSCPATEGKTYNLAGSEVLSFREMVYRVGKANGVRPVLVRVPLPAARLALSLASVAPRFRAIPRESLSRMNKNMIFDNSRAIADMAYQPRSFEPSAILTADQAGLQ